jgi:hypothetical protein
MTRILAGILTAVVMGIMVWTASRRSPDAMPPTVSQQSESRSDDSNALTRARLQRAMDRIEGLFASARSGDAAAYLAAFGGPLRARLQREADEAGQPAFANELRRASLARTSHSVFVPEPDAGGSEAVRITVESIFGSRIERQTYRLEHDSGGWLITEIETARRRVPDRALGSLATYWAPEGNPVAGDPAESVSE